jgi:dTDP-4-amino-4,6-dideoxygalactose transaminase
VFCRVGSCSEIWREQAFAPDTKPERPLPVAAELFETSLCYLVHPTLGTADIDDMIEATRKVLAVATEA